jgi:hypothetical protein
VTRSKVTLTSADKLLAVTAALEAFAAIMPHGAEARSSVEISGHRVEAVLALPDLREAARQRAYLRAGQGEQVARGAGAWPRATR